MKHVVAILTLASLFLSNLLSAQDLADNYKKRHAIYDYTETRLNNTDTIPGYGAQGEKLRITGTIYEHDGVTPASNVLLYICQADAEGDYQSKKVNGKRTLKHQGWIKTDTNGNYTFYTFIPGTHWGTKDLMQIHGYIKLPDTKTVYAIPHFVFDNDPFLKKSCRKKIEKRGINNILKLERKDGLLIGKRNIILQPNPQLY
jgi:protocatechuate 3,4-dioxygenase beta subunit